MSDLWDAAPRTRVYERVDAATFHKEIRPLGKPAILKGLVADWPIVRAAKQSPQALADYLRPFADGQVIESYIGPPEIAGRFSYGGDYKSFNFQKRALPLGALLDDLLANLSNENAPHIYAGAINLPRFLPRLPTENPPPLLDPSTELLASLWIGNRSRTAAHWDLPQNIACVVSGKRRYTLLPTAQIGNLYVGPVDVTLAGRPTSLVDFRSPDFNAHPRFREAMAHAEIADLEPGDGLYVPSLYFHHVESFDALSAMINFWWREGPSDLLSPFLTLLHGLTTLRDMPVQERLAWRALFDHYLFQPDGEPMLHLPEEARGLWGEMTPEKLRDLKAYLIRTLSK